VTAEQSNRLSVEINDSEDEQQQQQHEPFAYSPQQQGPGEVRLSFCG
jgi:hypothetical protein